MTNREMLDSCPGGAVRTKTCRRGGGGGRRRTEGGSEDRAVDKKRHAHAETGRSRQRVWIAGEEKKGLDSPLNFMRITPTAEQEERQQGKQRMNEQHVVEWMLQGLK